MIIFLMTAIIVATILLSFNRIELLKVIKVKEEVIDANTRAITELEGQNSLLRVTLEDNKKQLGELVVSFDTVMQQKDNLISTRKSHETRMGQVTEQIAPFLDNFKHDAKETRFLGSPIDLIAFNFIKPSITFIEVKTGNSKESKRQKLIKEAINRGNVYYEQMRVNGSGVTITGGERDA